MAAGAAEATDFAYITEWLELINPPAAVLNPSEAAMKRARLAMGTTNVRLAERAVMHCCTAALMQILSSALLCTVAAERTV